MFLLQSDELLDHTKDIIHKDTQQHKFSFDLSVAEIHTFTEAGSLDFGGSEFEPASSRSIAPEKQNADDKYGWWNLEQGMYKAVFNEQLQNNEDTLTIISPHEHAIQAGIIAGTNLITDEVNKEQLSMNFQVPAVGCRIKENARFANLQILAD